jgi:excisionase family DNA binding protein
MAAVGNLNDYVKYQMGQGMAAGGSGGVAGIGAEMAVGLGLAQQMMNQPGGLMAQATKGVEAPVPTNGGRGIELMNPAQVAQMLGVAESDVLASLESGDLKGRKIGTQWRVTKSAVDAFLQP